MAGLSAPQDHVCFIAGFGNKLANPDASFGK